MEERERQTERHMSKVRVRVSESAKGRVLERIVRVLHNIRNVNFFYLCVRVWVCVWISVCVSKGRGRRG